MIYQPIDVSLQTNARAIKAGTAMYLWTFAMLWSRDHRESGHVPMHVLLTCPWGNPKENRAAVARLLDSGLMDQDGEGVSLRNYAAKNDTREVIEKRIEGGRSRQSAFKAKQRTGNARVTRFDFVSPDSDSHSGSDVVSDPDRKTDPEPTPKTAYLAAGSVPDDIPITEAIRARCFSAGAPMPTRDHVQLMLATRRTNPKAFVDPIAEIVAWMLRQKSYDARAKNGGKPVETGPPETRARTMSERPKDDWSDIDESQYLPKKTGTT